MTEQGRLIEVSHCRSSRLAAGDLVYHMLTRQVGHLPLFTSLLTTLNGETPLIASTLQPHGRPRGTREKTPDPLFWPPGIPTSSPDSGGRGLCGASRYLFVHTIDVQSIIKYEWDPQKNEWLKKARRISIEQVIFHLSQGDVWKIADHPDQKKYPSQKAYFVVIEGYVYLVPHIGEKQYIFFKKRLSLTGKPQKSI